MYKYIWNQRTDTLTLLILQYFGEDSRLCTWLMFFPHEGYLLTVNGYVNQICAKILHNIFFEYTEECGCWTHWESLNKTKLE